MADRQEGGRRDRGRVSGLGVAVGALGLAALLGIAGLIAVYTGAYNVAATEEHASFTRWAFDTTFHNSVESRADDVAAPAAFTPAMIAAGAGPYKTMCQHCHAGPGVERAEWAGGMRPRPPHLTEAAAEWEPQEVFWLVKHGVKMSGMPAFGPTHGDQAIWNIAAFVKQLPAMTSEEYARLGGGQQGGGHHGGATQATGAGGGGSQSSTPQAAGAPGGTQGSAPADAGGAAHGTHPH
ncbi:c-type cytochrome [Microvirga splendida]|uniref:Cytochrome c n=1 Tax=Microvirga splendida TaxID=2795727 RepID=A0ABS0XZK5_9HYPH|nr:cytochrome c [Microvirga splendida]MBJ6125468.1 cytochrome c [Microvirga splendida]